MKRTTIPYKWSIMRKWWPFITHRLSVQGQLEKIGLMTFAYFEGYNQAAQLCSLILALTVCMRKSWILCLPWSYPEKLLADWWMDWAEPFMSTALFYNHGNHYICCNQEEGMIWQMIIPLPKLDFLINSKFRVTSSTVAKCWSS